MHDVHMQFYLYEALFSSSVDHMKNTLKYVGWDLYFVYLFNVCVCMNEHFIVTRGKVAK